MDYFKNIFKGIDDSILLDKEQIEAIKDESKYSLIIAGAGSGKTTTMAAKVKYLVDIKKIKEEEIIVISYTNKAVNELKERINNDFKLNVLVTTFHKLGLDILSNYKQVRILNNSYDVIKDFFNNMNDSEMDKFIEFFLYYFDIPKFALKFNNIKEYFRYKNKFDYLTFKTKINTTKYIYEKLNSNEEVMIANFLYLNNIEYEYNQPYNREYRPDFKIKQNNKVIYIELYDLSLYKGLERIKYLYKINKIRNLHKLYHTDLIEIYVNKNMLNDLKKELLIRNIVLNPKSKREIFNQIKKLTNDKYYKRFILFCIKFIEGFKIKGYNCKDFKLLKENQSERTILFLDFVEKLYIYYQKKLKDDNLIDFEDMINEAYLKLNKPLNYKYIIIDEYQDISNQRFKLIKRISELSDSKIIAVGDDFQSIFAFAGSSISLFTNFKQQFNNARLLKITNTYRNSQQLIDIAGNFVMNNHKQINKKLFSFKDMNNPIIIVFYENEINMFNYCLDEIYKKNNNSKILVTGRYNFLKNNLKHNKDIILDEKIKSIKYPTLRIDFLSVHASKGLGYDNVIILDCSDDLYGFPSQIKDDPIMNLIIDREEYKYAEERRLFYVALTRTKNKVYILTPNNKPSPFVLELLKYKNIKVINKASNKIISVCPKCGYPLIKQYENNIGHYYKCSNEKEICNFKTNNLNYLKDIRLCPKCNGYLIVKEYNNHYFIGCTNYKNGCKYKEKI